ncbi:hypothetical protein LL14B4_10400 [Lactococcus lactis subsp. lactis]|uniref:Uncharacterized protein n=1 Tax=Lactococcus lactis subsp. lactis TaxID=1360 RepID=A0A2Z3KQF0_LACLL|nr:hypothetical protein [Lactococcus lactis]AWN66563.1 hypothetical protein LL14B4_10400 [Lactococcus lactis subsp. lactis]
MINQIERLQKKLSITLAALEEISKSEEKIKLGCLVYSDATCDAKIARKALKDIGHYVSC